jgi:hypothetical protein
MGASTLTNNYWRGLLIDVLERCYRFEGMRRRALIGGFAASLTAVTLALSGVAYAGPPPVVESPYVLHFIKVVRMQHSQRFVLRVDGPAGTVGVMVTFVKRGGTLLGPYHRTIETNRRQGLVFRVSPKIKYYRLAAPA